MKRKASSILRALRTADDVCRLTTGKRLNEILANATDIFGHQVLDESAKEQDEAEIARRLPYIILGVNPDSPDFIVRAAFKAHMKTCHPDTNKGDEEKAKAINNAYDKICAERGISK